MKKNSDCSVSRGTHSNLDFDLIYLYWGIWDSRFGGFRRCNIFIGNCHTGWQRPIGCLKLQVIFRKRTTNYRALLQKMTYEYKPSYASSPLCIVARLYSSVYWWILLSSLHTNESSSFAGSAVYSLCMFTCKHTCIHTYMYVYIHICIQI